MPEINSRNSRANQSADAANNSEYIVHTPQPRTLLSLADRTRRRLTIITTDNPRDVHYAPPLQTAPSHFAATGNPSPLSSERTSMRNIIATNATLATSTGVTTDTPLPHTPIPQFLERQRSIAPLPIALNDGFHLLNQAQINTTTNNVLGNYDAKISHEPFMEQISKLLPSHMHIPLNGLKFLNSQQRVVFSRLLVALHETPVMYLNKNNRKHEFQLCILKVLKYIEYLAVIWDRNNLNFRGTTPLEKLTTLTDEATKLTDEATKLTDEATKHCDKKDDPAVAFIKLYIHAIFNIDGETNPKKRIELLLNKARHLFLLQDMHEFIEQDVQQSRYDPAERLLKGIIGLKKELNLYIPFTNANELEYSNNPYCIFNQTAFNKFYKCNSGNVDVFLTRCVEDGGECMNTIKEYHAESYAAFYDVKINPLLQEILSLDEREVSYDINPELRQVKKSIKNKITEKTVEFLKIILEEHGIKIKDELNIHS